jgi:hypothetical protein
MNLIPHGILRCMIHSFQISHGILRCMILNCEKVQVKKLHGSMGLVTIKCSTPKV